MPHRQQDLGAAAGLAKKLAQHGPSSGASAKKLAQQAQKRRNWGVLSVLGELFRARTHTRTSRAKNFAHRTHKHGDIETNNTTAHPKQGTTETGITSAPENCTQNAHFPPAKATAVSIPHRHKQAKAIAVSIPHRHKQAKATMVSNHLTNTPGPTGAEDAGGTPGPGCGARGRWRDLAGQRADSPNRTSVRQASPVWREPEGPEGTGGLRGAAPNAVRAPSLAGGRALRRPEHPWGRRPEHQRGHKQSREHRRHNKRRPEKATANSGGPKRRSASGPSRVSVAHRLSWMLRPGTASISSRV